MRFLARKTLLILAILLFGLLLSLAVGCAGYGPETKTATESESYSAEQIVESVQKIKINSLDELPVHTYPLLGSVSEMMADPVAMKELRIAYRANLQGVLDTYLIEDTATLKGKYGSLLTLNMAEERFDEALLLVEKIKAMEDKETARLMTGISTRAYIAAHKATGKQPVDAEFQTVYSKTLEKEIFGLPWDVVQDRIKSSKGRAEFVSENLLVGMIQTRIDPAAAAMGELDDDLAGTAIRMRYAIDKVLPLNPIVADVYGRFMAANKKEKQNVWPARELTLTADQNLQPVVVGIWDSGVDVDVFADQMFVNTNEKVDGTDTDNNGFVDDINGIAYDMHGLVNPHLLHPMGDQEGNLDAVFEYTQGFTDLGSAVDSPEASSVRKLLANIPPADVGDVMTTLAFGSLYMHGSHVSGIAVKGNPFARILVARTSFDYHSPPLAMTMERAQHLADSFIATTKYFQENNVRVANMSWGWTYAEIEQSLTSNGVGDSADERVKMAREMLDVISVGLKQALTSTPEILYVSAAGNDDNDVEFDLTIPSGYDLPNLMVVGAVDQAGEPTSFTSGGQNVRVFANGFQVESQVPGGTSKKMSGTSMSSPNVCNLAAKLLALNPELGPQELIKLIEAGSDAHAANPDLLLINPVKTAELLKK